MLLFVLKVKLQYIFAKVIFILPVRSNDEASLCHDFFRKWLLSRLNTKQTMFYVILVSHAAEYKPFGAHSHCRSDGILCWISRVISRDLAVFFWHREFEQSV